MKITDNRVAVTIFNTRDLEPGAWFYITNLESLYMVLANDQNDPFCTAWSFQHSKQYRLRQDIGVFPVHVDVVLV